MAAKNKEQQQLEQWEEQVQFYRDHLDIFIEEQLAPIKLKQQQHIVAREFGRCFDLKIVKSRGFGKSWQTAVCCIAISIQYPGTICLVCSATAKQATIVQQKIKMLADQNPNIMREIAVGSARSAVQQSDTKGKVTFKNGSYIESFSLSSMLGQRAKIIVVDESPEVNQDDLNNIVAPIKNYKRDICHTYGFDDYPSKIVNITSACEKTNGFYGEFIRVVRAMAKGDKNCFACALDYQAAIRNGITDKSFFDQERERQPQSVFDLQYGSIFIGAATNSMFPYDLTDGCRTQTKVETQQPKGGTSKYVISLDIATSDSDNADNAIITVIKIIEKSDGTFSKKVVQIKSFHGKGQDVQATELRKTYVRFPNTIRIVYDANGLGDSLPKFLDEPWVDPGTGKEYPPFVLDDARSFIPNAQPLQHAVKANPVINQRMANTQRVALEKRSIEQPVNSRIIYENQGDKKSDMSTGFLNDFSNIANDELAVYIEADALQFEMGNIVQRVTQSGTYTYDTARSNQHKDRYSSLAMGVDFIQQMEDQNMRKYRRSSNICIGITSNY